VDFQNYNQAIEKATELEIMKIRKEIKALKEQVVKISEDL
jgi:hypothetical protein